MRVLKYDRSISKIDRQIAFLISCAQAASDGGKRIMDLIDESPLRGWRQAELENAWRKGYSVKDQYIAKAIELIGKSNTGCFHYSFSEDPFIGSLIVYFTFRIFKNDGTTSRQQVSFHTFLESRKLEKLASMYHKGCKQKTRWDRGSSRDTVLDLLEYVTW